jgi:hypothetical protein
VSITLVDGDGSSEGFDSTDVDGNYSVTPFGGSTRPYLVKVSAVDSCDTAGSAFRELAIGPFPDGSAGGNLILDVKSFCSGFQESGGPPPTAIIDPALARIVSLPGGVAYLNLRNIVGISATDIQFVLADGTPVGGRPDSTNVAITAPAADYDGPLLVGFTVEGQRYTRTIGTLTARKATAPVALPGPIDLQANVDVSGSMATTDPANVRRDAVNLLLDLARPADRVGATGFDNVFRPIFHSTVITGKAAVIRRLKSLAGAGIGNFGDTDYNFGLFEGYRALSSPGLDPNRQKAVIFLTDGAEPAPLVRLQSERSPVADLRSAARPAEHVRARRRRAPQAHRQRDRGPVPGHSERRPADGPLLPLLRWQHRAEDRALQGRPVPPRATARVRRAADEGARERHLFVSWGDAAAKFSATLRAPGGRAYSVPRFDEEAWWEGGQAQGPHLPPVPRNQPTEGALEDHGQAQGAQGRPARECARARDHDTMSRPRLGSRRKHHGQGHDGHAYTGGRTRDGGPLVPFGWSAQAANAAHVRCTRRSPPTRRSTVT